MHENNMIFVWNGTVSQLSHCSRVSSWNGRPFNHLSARTKHILVLWGMVGQVEPSERARCDKCCWSVCTFVDMHKDVKTDVRKPGRKCSYEGCVSCKSCWCILDQRSESGVRCCAEQTSVMLRHVFQDYDRMGQRLLKHQQEQEKQNPSSFVLESRLIWISLGTLMKQTQICFCFDKTLMNERL